MFARESGLEVREKRPGLPGTSVDNGRKVKSEAACMGEF